MKLDLKEWVNKVTDALRVTQTQKFTACGKTWNFRRIGKVVYFDAPNDITSASAGLNLLGTLPSGMIPDYPQRVCLGNNATATRFVQIGNDGKVYLYTSTAISSAMNGSCSSTYVVGGGTL